MNFTNFDFSEKGIFRRLTLISIVSALGEAISYPLDRLKVREIARKQFQSNSIFSETRVILNQILSVEKSSGLTYGLRAGLDRALAMNLTRFLVFDFLTGRPHDSSYQPMAASIQFFASALAAQSMGVLISQPSTTLKLKIQCEPLGLDFSKYEMYSEKYRRITKFHQNNSSILFSNGIKSALIFNNALAVCEIALFFPILQYFYNHTNIRSDSFKITFTALIASTVSTIILHPLDFIYHRYALRNLAGEPTIPIQTYLKQVFAQESGVATLYKGLVPSIARNSLTAVTTFFIWDHFSYTSHNELLYNYHSKKAQEASFGPEDHKKYVMTGGRNASKE